MWQSQKSPWTNIRFHHHLERQLDILAPKKDGQPQSIRPVQPSFWPFSIRSGLSVLRLTPMGLTLLCRAPSPAGWACGQWAGSARDQPLGGEGVEQQVWEACGAAFTHRLWLLLFWGLGTSVQIWKYFASQEKADTQNVFILNGWGWGSLRIPWKPCNEASS